MEKSLVYMIQMSSDAVGETKDAHGINANASQILLI